MATLDVIERISDTVWEIPVSYKQGMRVPARIYGTEKLIREMDDRGRPVDAGWRLWAQTEALRTCLLFDPNAAAALSERIFDVHLATETPGLWMDSYDADGRPADRAAPEI